LAGLVVGVMVGTRTDLPGQFEDEPSSRSPVVVGLVSDIFAESASEWEFELPVFNATAAPVDATLVGFDGAALGLSSDTAQNLAGGTWGTIQFSVAANCDALVPGPMNSVRLRVHTGAETSVTTLPLPGRGLVLRDYHQAMCASADPVAARDLVGVWVVETVYGSNAWLDGRTLLMRFDRDGTFVTDSEGDLFTEEVDVRGRYRLEGDLLTIDVTGSVVGCLAPSRATWRVTVRDARMSMVWVRGVCPSGEPGHAWVLERVIPASGMPGSPG
jgi:hypothetical protein